MARKLFLTGEPGVGKTTVLRKVLSNLGDDCVGFYAVELRDESEKRIGFNLETVNLSEMGGALAHVDFNTSLHVGRYQVDTADLERIITAPELFNENKLLLIDEIGHMQSFSEPYRKFVDKALSDPNQSVLAIVKAAPTPWVDDVKAKFSRNIPTYNITEGNRDAMPMMIKKYLNVNSAD